MNEICKTPENNLVCIPKAGTAEKPTIWRSPQMLVANLLAWGKGPEKEFCFGEQSKKVEVGDSVLEALVLENKEREDFLKEVDVARTAFTRG